MFKGGLILSCLIVVSPWAWPQTATPSPSSGGNAQQKTVVRMAELRLNPQKYAGQTLTFSGIVDGLITSSDGYTIIFRSAEGDRVFIRAAGTVPVEVSPGYRVQISVKIPANNGYIDSLELVQISAAPPPKPTASSAPVAAAAKTGAAGVGQTATPAASAYKLLDGKGKVISSSQSATPASKGKSLPSRGGVSSADRTVSGMLPEYKQAIRKFNPSLNDARLTQIAAAILRFSLQNNLDPRLTLAVIAAESGFRLDATSRSGAMGLGQLMPGTAAGMGVSNAYDPEQNIQAAVRIISGHLRNYSQKPDGFYRALAAYNAGSGAVRKYGGVPPYRQTVNYIWKIYYLYKQLAPDQFR